MTTSAARPTARELIQRIADGELAARDNLAQFLARMDKHNPVLNAVIHDGRDRAKAIAEQIDADLAAGRPVGRLAGLVMTIKDSFDVEGWPTTFGLEHLKDNVAERTSDVVSRLEAEGALIVGKTNVPPLLRDWQSGNPIHGHTRNPWNTDLSPGGSSGGAAAAVAAGLCSAEIGSDIGGSIRIPAHYCGICGHKPSNGVVSMIGHQLPGTYGSSAMVSAGPLAANVDDMALLLDVVAGADSRNAPAWRLELPPARITTIGDFRVGILDNAPTAPVDGAYRAVIGALGERLRQAGASVTEGPFRELDTTHLHDLFIRILRAMAVDGLSDPEFSALIAQVERTPRDDQSYVAATNRAMVQRHRDWRRARQEVGRLKHDMRVLFRQIDVLLMPAAVSAAFPIDFDRPREERTLLIDGVERDYNEQLLWAALPVLAELPATLIPIGLQDNGLPVGVQVVGEYLDDRTCIAFAREVERLVGVFSPPGYD
ncbi:amidase [Natronocella acetinitrilica]|uniref:Amidase n=1 Tax=Natronocella acetinitrilica TaxID=414046 RepID=A0AAE3KDU9_9GAMM|nr:amidase family protein [Natronocella acetinitrilica]MCP1676743.1 amidase [Natronocella acetinitrilica]